jgi:antirestriction protein ArdC
LPDLVERIKEVDKFVENTGADIRHGGVKAFHCSKHDGSESYIQMPLPERFIPVNDSTPTENYYATLLHELTHWTKTPKRLNRKFNLTPAKRNYALEELVAEIGASMLGASLKIEQQPRENHMEYIASWLKILKSDKKAFFKAAAKAQEATTFLYKMQDIETEKCAA